jgi:hypothetical protein
MTMKRIKISSDDAKAVSASASAGAEESLDEGAKESDDEEDDDDNGSFEEVKVIMKEKDVPSAPGGIPTLVNDGTGHKKADRAVKNRIIKLLHSLIDESNKDKAKKTAKLAQRLMKKHNLSQEILHEEHRREASTMYATTTTVYRINDTPCLLPSSPGGVSDEDKKPAAEGSAVAEEDNDNDCEDEDESLSQTGTP